MADYLARAIAFCGVALFANLYFNNSPVLRTENPYDGFFSKHGYDKDFHLVSKEEVRTYWDNKPCNSGWQFPGIAPGTKEYFDEVEKRKYFVEYHIPEWAKFEDWKGKKVLEVGGGMCTTAVSFAKAGADISVIDISPKSMQLCRARFHAYDLKANYYIGDAEHLASTVPVEPYDLIWSFGVIHHSPYPEHSMREIKKFMGPSTRLKLMLYAKVSFKLFWVMNHTGDWDMAHLDKTVAWYSEAVEGSPVTYTYTMSDARTLVEEAGLEVVSMEKAHIFPYEINHYKRNEYVKEDIWQRVKPERFRDLERELGWHLLVEARLPRS